MSAWWDDLPDGSVVLDHHYPNTPLARLKGRWFRLKPAHVADEPANVTVIHVPVTDAEPPVGSLVETSGGLAIRHDDGWRPYGEHWAPMGWQSVKPAVTRILRWGK